MIAWNKTEHIPRSIKTSISCVYKNSISPYWASIPLQQIKAIDPTSKDSLSDFYLLSRDTRLLFDRGDHWLSLQDIWDEFFVPKRSLDNNKVLEYTEYNSLNKIQCN